MALMLHLDMLVVCPRNVFLESSHFDFLTSFLTITFVLVIGQACLQNTPFKFLLTRLSKVVRTLGA